MQAIIFDMDGLMLDTEPISYMAWKQALADWQYTLHKTDYLPVIGTTLPDTQRAFMALFGPELPFAEIRERQQEVMQGHIAEHGIPLKPGLLPLLEWVTTNQIPIAVASSTARPLLLKKLALTGIDRYFETIVGGDEIKHGKPAPDIFLEAARRLDISPKDCLVLEDSEPGVQSAHTAGMTVMMIPDMKQPSNEIKSVFDYIATSLHEGLSYIKRIFR